VLSKFVFMMSRTLHDRTPSEEVSAYEEASQNYHYRKLYQLAKPTMKQGDEEKLKRAFHFALTAKQQQQYWETSVNRSHAFDIAHIVASEMGLGVVSIICALLYDLVEGITPVEIKKIFGAQVAQIINKLHALESIPQLREIKSLQSAEVLMRALTQDPMVALLKMAENLQNMRGLANLSPKKQADILSQAKHIYVSIAHRLGLNAIKAELEDLYLKFTDMKVYHAINKQIRDQQNTQERFIQRFKRPIQELLKTTNIPFSIKTRTKSVTSIRNKMRASDMFFEQVYDVSAIRIILDVSEQIEKLNCWKAYEVVTGLYKVHPYKFRNWLSYPRNNGYQALHVTVMSDEGEWVEVQIRTKRMDKIAEYGNAAHWRYKKTSDVGDTLGIDAWLRQLRNSLEAEKRVSTEYISTLDTSLQIAKIEVFTHTNQSISLPVGATVLDFAFELGMNFGLWCTGGKVNNKLVAYHYKLDHGDQVKVITAKKKQVLEDWLDCTVTYTAHHAIKKFLQRKKDQKIAIGEKLVRKQLKQFALKWNSKTIELLLVALDEENTEDLYYKLGDGSIALLQLENFLSALNKAREHRLPHQKLKPPMQSFNDQDRTLDITRVS